MPEFLKNIIEYKKDLIQKKQSWYLSIKQGMEKGKVERYGIFKKRISTPGKIALIAEIKKASPSKGLIRKEFDLLKIANIYSENNADAVSVLTEDKYFLGRPEYIKAVADHVHIPVLAKDFFIDEGQIYEARYNGASAILLIMACLDLKKTKDFLKLASSLDLDCLVEVHSEYELKMALDCGAEIIGINNRNLKTFEVDILTCEKLIPKIPKWKVIVAESGIKSNKDVLRLKELGVNAVLIGEAFMREEDISAKIREIMDGK